LNDASYIAWCYDTAVCIARRVILFLLVLLICPVVLAQTPTPVILYANELGGSGKDTPPAMAMGADGSIYIAGVTTSADFPGAQTLSSSHSAQWGDVFVVKVNPAGTAIIYGVIVGGTVNGGGPLAMALDADGNAYVAGSNAAPDFPTTPGSISAGVGQCFLFKLNISGSILAYSTALPCAEPAMIYPNGLTVDSQGNVVSNSALATVQ
jgi:hypothetical protein